MSHLLQNAGHAVEGIAKSMYDHATTDLGQGFDIDLRDVKEARADDHRPTVTEDILSYLGSRCIQECEG